MILFYLLSLLSSVRLWLVHCGACIDNYVSIYFEQASLGGSARAVFLATVSPSPYNFAETLETLRYADITSYIAGVVESLLP